ncbi:class IV adenylate cyclase [Patescibacteria group bacterium]|nr:class IV adenylate cyclase [Patescibacteria group bacterium]
MEIEIKAKVKDLKKVRRQLIKLGAKPKKKVHQIDAYYSLYKRPFNKKKGSVVRVRHNKNKHQTFFEFDWALNSVAAHEIEIEVSSLENINKILKLMKARKEVVVDKQREYFKKGVLEIVLDRVKGLGDFMEIEIQGKDSKSNRQRIINFYQQIGINKNDFVLGPKYNSMLLAKKGKKYAYF